MDAVSSANDEVFRRHKNYFAQYIDSDDSNLPDKIRALAETEGGSKRLMVDLNVLRVYDGYFTNGNDEANIVTRLLQQPSEYLPPLEDAVRDAIVNAQNSYNPKAALTVDASQVEVGLEGDFGAHFMTPRGLVASFLSQCVCVHGIVTKCSAVRPKVVKSVHYCKETNSMVSREYRDHTSLTGAPTTSVYPTKDENGNLLETEFGLCQYKDYQVLTIQETPETAPLGQLPRSCDVTVEADLVDKCKPGDRIHVIGVFRAIASQTVGEDTWNKYDSYGSRQAASSSGVFKTALLANNVQVMGKEVHGIVMTTEDVMHVREFAKRGDAMDILSRSIAPSIFGHAAIKQALLLQLLGGVEKNLDNGTHLRGDINVLMVGDPSTAKSQLLRFVRNLAPLAVSTTGRGSSGVGLTAAVTLDPDTKEKRLEAGAMVLADRGIVCIDEFDKMGEADRVAIHEVMEQQTVTIAKAGIHATLNARCSVLAAANPVYGQYQKNKRPQENIGLPDSLLSRFDLLFVVLDSLDRHADRMISDHVLRNHRYCAPGDEGRPISFHTTEIWTDKDAADAGMSIFQPYDPLLHPNSNKEGVLTVPFLKKFIHYAKTRLPPVLTEPARDLIAEGYAALRSQQTQRTLPVTARTLETLIRLASAHAKARLSKYIELPDATHALNLMKYALYHEVSTEATADDRPGTTTRQEDEPVDEDEETQDVDMPELPPPAKRFKVDEEMPKQPTDDLRQRVTAYLSQVTSEENEESMGQQFYVKDLLTAVNKGQPKRATAKQLGVVLMALEEENKLMYLRDGDDPSIMLV
ncbi:hypothetical protein H257_01595 [Aphanomyces astaci]|uniref:DNA replication licensing factor MCM3 n=2 Tax=Aphanomyces astaci TaxID=112090 RepID=W4H9S6_APHAT|nr:hypothetical protein H257_01595 [Aphanomyces astaci]ETV88321.1 hypothetical protein H257_01595 [Aphanomyces astaci]|eukprot:XP_009823184.1 hypothetical protein H257_01595 [Aphanomyces astaci]